MAYYAIDGLNQTREPSDKGNQLADGPNAIYASDRVPFQRQFDAKNRKDQTERGISVAMC